MGLKVKGCPKVLPERAPWRYRSLGRPWRQEPVSGGGPLREQTPALRANNNLEGNFDKNVAGFRRIIRQCYPRHGNTPRATPEGQLVPSGSSPGATRCRATSLQKNEPHGLACVNQMAEEEGFAGRSAPSPRRAPCGACGLRWKTRSRFLSSAPSRVRIMQGPQKNEPHGLACVNQMAEEEGFEPSYGEYP